MPDETVTKRPRLVVEEEVESTPSLPLKSEELPSASTTLETQTEPTPPPPSITSFGLVTEKPSESVVEDKPSSPDTQAKDETGNDKDSLLPTDQEVKDAAEANPAKDLDKKTEESPIATTETTKADDSSAETGILADNPTSDEVKAWLKDIRPDNTKETVKEGGGLAGKFMIVLLVLLAIGLLGGGFYYFTNSMNGSSSVANNNSNTNNSEVSPTPTEAPEVTPTSMPETVDYTKLSLQILNGSGKPGEAGKAQALVNDLKFKDTKTGNAPNFNFKETKVEMKSGVSSSAFETLKEKLSKTYKVEASAGSLPASSSYDVVITVGSTLAQ